MCYTIYLYHFSVISFFVSTLGNASFLRFSPLWVKVIVLDLVTVPVILLSSTLLFIFIEKPCMRKDWHLRLRDRFRPVADQA